MYWKSALIQHPMFLIIKEDTGCAERTPPWGAPSLELYIERVRDNLSRIRKYPEIRIGFEWSGLEVEMLAQEAPDVFREMCALAKEGRVGFYNGTYAQPHLQMLSPEANIRQFEFGMRVYREMCDYPVITYAHQETSIHDQSPQIMSAFGIKYSALPQFPSTVKWLDGGEIVTRLQRPQFIHEQEFVQWLGLDGTEMPLYLNPNLENINEWVAGQMMYGLMHEPPIMLEIPDLVEVDDEWIAHRKDVEMVLLDQAFLERIEVAPPQSRVRHYTYWSYIEGIRAEELSRNNLIAEDTALQAESLNAMAFTLLNRPTESTDPVWKTILTSQHHDVYCFCAPELKFKAIGWLQEAARDARQIAARAADAIALQVDTTRHEGTPVVVFNTVPHPQQTVVSFAVEGQNWGVVNGQGETIPSDVQAISGNKFQVRLIEQAQGWGYNTYWLQNVDTKNPEAEIIKPVVFKNNFYRAEVQPDGTITSLKVKPSGKELLAVGLMVGNQLAATDSTGIGPQISPGLHNRPRWKIPEAGTELKWQPSSTARVRHTALGMTIVVPGTMGKQVSGSISINFYHSMPRIDLSYDFEFDNAAIGSFYLDNSKLRVHWPLAFKGAIHHDIPFGVIENQADRQLLPITWIDISDGDHGLAYFHRGTFKHWVEDNTLVNLFAWGEETNAIGSRMWRENWNKSFDQLLRGHHSIHAALYPHAGDWRDADVIGAARAYNRPAVGYLTEHHSGPLPERLNLLTVNSSEIVVTAVKVEDARVKCRLYSTAKEVRPLTFSASRLTVSSRQALAGQDISELSPFQIGVVTLKPK